MSKAVDQHLVEAQLEEEGLLDTWLDICHQKYHATVYTYHHSFVVPDLVGHSRLAVGSLAVGIVVEEVFDLRGEGVFDLREEELRKMVVEVDKTFG